MIPGALARILFKISERLPIGRRHGPGYWRRRALLLGPEAAVIGIGEQVDEFTQHQLEAVMPVVQAIAPAGARLAVDFGCGPGRLSHELSRVAGADVLGVDPTRRLIDAARPGPGVQFAQIHRGRIPINDGSADLVFVCLVLGGVPDSELVGIAKEIDRVLRPGGALVLVETVDDPEGSHGWRARSPEHYSHLFEFARLETQSTYHHGEELAAVMAGRRAARPT